MLVNVHSSDETGNVYTLAEEITYKDLVIPAGFSSDGASVPRFFWRAVFPPGDTRALFAAFVHDFIYRTHPSGWSKRQADREFYHLLIRYGVPKTSAMMAFAGVALFGWPSWNKNK